MDLSDLELGKTLNKYMIILWPLEAYPDLITGINPEDRSQIKGFVEKKVVWFCKGRRYMFIARHFYESLKKNSEAGMSESDFAQRDRIIEPFKVKIVKE